MIILVYVDGSTGVKSGIYIVENFKQNISDPS